MTDRATLAALVARVKAAKVADRGLDADVFAVRHPDWKWCPREPRAFTNPDDAEWIRTPPAYTASLDAAASLVPTKPVPNMRLGKWWWMLEAWPSECRASVHYENGDAGILETEAKAATPALALTAAALRAMMETMDDA